MVRLLPAFGSSRISPAIPSPHLRQGLLTVLVLMSGLLGSGTAARAQAPVETPAAETTPANPVPAEIQTLLTHMDQAASQEDLEGVMDQVSHTYTHTDGLTYDTLEEALRAFWERYDNLSYTTTVNAWEQDGSATVVMTTTQITGTQSLGSRTLNLTSTLTSRQRYEDGKLVQQETLTENSQVTGGENPPDLRVNLPEQISIGQPFVFDAIVVEPLGDRQLLGLAVEEPVNPSGYQVSPPLNLELLTAGGLFKVGRAPALPTQSWISGLIIREDGLTLVTRRVRFEAN